MSLQERAKAAGKNIEGKLEAALGNATAILNNM
jgi:hypothetical protein